MAKMIKAANGCWNVKPHKGNRYPMLNVGGRLLKMHRLAWQEFYGQIPQGVCVLHKCDNTHCINPRHLFLGSHGDNMRDAASKGRLKIPVCPPEKKARGDNSAMRKHPGLLAGERNGRSKLTNKQREQIVARRAAGQTRESLAQAFGVSSSQIGRLCLSHGVTSRPKRWTKKMRAAITAGRTGESMRRNTKGSRNPRAKLTEADVTEIRRLAAERVMFQRDIALRFGVCLVTVEKIIARKLWSHIA
jgi:hypothetical protein